jgi:capsid protein
MGIEVDSYLRPQAYHFYANHPGDTYAGNVRTNGRRLRVPADEVIHLFLPERPGQTQRRDVVCVGADAAAHAAGL